MVSHASSIIRRVHAACMHAYLSLGSSFSLLAYIYIFPTYLVGPNGRARGETERAAGDGN